METHPDYTPLIPHKLYYKTLSTGTTISLENLNSQILINYELKTLEGELLLQHHYYKTYLSELLLGVAYALPGMKVGEKREIIIHPERSSPEETRPLLAHIELIEILSNHTPSP